MTKDKIIRYLTQQPAHATSKRDIQMRHSYRVDFNGVYQQLIDQEIIQEYGAGTKANPRMVCLTFRYLQSLPSPPAGQA